MENFNSELTPGNVKAATAGIKSADLWQFPPEQLRVVPGFNVRANEAKNAEKIRAIADSIKANGYYRDKALAGYVGKDDGEDVVYITGGHRRHAAVLLAISEGAEVPTVPVITSPKGTSMEDLTVALVRGNEGEPLTLYECAVACKRLAGFGWESAEIARRPAPYTLPPLNRPAPYTLPPLNRPAPYTLPPLNRAQRRRLKK